MRGDRNSMGTSDSHEGEGRLLRTMSASGGCGRAVGSLAVRGGGGKEIAQEPPTRGEAAEAEADASPAPRGGDYSGSMLKVSG